jgi:hypothetical protein
MDSQRPWRPSIPENVREQMNAEGDKLRQGLRSRGLPAEPLYYDRDGKPLRLGDWAEAMRDLDYKRVARDFVGHIEVSTVWLGLDHSYVGGGTPIIFETMCFVWVGGERVTDDERMERYATEAEARAGHERIVAQVKAQQERNQSST